MSPLFGPILAQLVTLGVSDRTEVRYLAPVDRHVEASNSPRLALIFGWKHTTLTFAYGPSVTVTPLDSKSPDVIVFHNAAIAEAYRWRRTTVTAVEAVGFGEIDFETLALGDPRAIAPAAGNPDKPSTPTGGATTPPTSGTGVPPTGTPATGAPGTLAPTANQTQNQIVKFATFTTSINVTQAVSQRLSVAGELGYSVTGSVGSESSDNYPIVKGPRALVSGAYQVTRSDDLTSMLTGLYAASSNGNNAWIAVANETWGHSFDARTATRFGTGLSVTRNALLDGTIAYSIYPTFNGSIAHTSLLGRGNLSFGTALSSAPALDPVRAAVDPRLTVSAFVGFGQDRFSSSLAAGTALSLAQQNSLGALSSANGSLTFAYRLGNGFSTDTGVRTAWQNFEGRTTVPLTWAAFLGLTYGASVRLNGGI